MVVGVKTARDSPCLDCQRRYVGCHGMCAEYGRYAEARKARSREVGREAEIHGYITRSVYKAKKRKNINPYK